MAQTMPEVQWSYYRQDTGASMFTMKSHFNRAFEVLKRNADGVNRIGGLVIVFTMRNTVGSMFMRCSLQLKRVCRPALLTPLRVSFSMLLLFVAWVGSQLAFATRPSECRDYRLVFGDEFDTFDVAARDTATSRECRWYEGVWFSHGHIPFDSFAVRNSELSLMWRRGQQQADSSVSTWSRTSPDRCAWRYGYFEARMKWTPLEGAWPAFWMIPVPPVELSRPFEAGEIDVFEGQGQEAHTFFGTIHDWYGSKELASSSSRNRFSLPSNTDMATYHTYGLLWVPGRVTWYFDGVALHSEVAYPVFDKQDYMLVLGMQEGANWNAGDLTDVTAQSLTLTVDWVRVWQKE